MTLDPDDLRRKAEAARVALDAIVGFPSDGGEVEGRITAKGSSRLDGYCDDIRAWLEASHVLLDCLAAAERGVEVSRVLQKFWCDWHVFTDSIEDRAKDEKQ